MMPLSHRWTLLRTRQVFGGCDEASTKISRWSIRVRPHAGRDRHDIAGRHPSCLGPTGSGPGDGAVGAFGGTRGYDSGGSRMVVQPRIREPARDHAGTFARDCKYRSRCASRDSNGWPVAHAARARAYPQHSERVEARRVLWREYGRQLERRYGQGHGGFQRKRRRASERRGPSPHSARIAARPWHACLPAPGIRQG
jgi:hypothetical protein